MFLSIVQKRRSIRKFQPKPIESEKIDMLVEAALRAPSSMGSKPWDFVFVTSQSLLEKLSRAKQSGSAFVRNAALGVVVCADPGRSSVWIEDASIASIFIHMAAESLGLGSCWIQIRERQHDEKKTAEDYIRDILNIPEHLKVEAIIGVGYPDEQKAPHRKEELQYEKVHLDSYGKPYQQ